MQLCVWLHCSRVKQIRIFFYCCVWAEIGKFDGHFTHLLFVGLWKDETPVRWEVGWMSIDFLVFLFKALSLWKEGTVYFTTFLEITLNGVKSAVFTSRLYTARENIKRWPLSNSRLTTKSLILRSFVWHQIWYFMDMFYGGGSQPAAAAAAASSMCVCAHAQSSNVRFWVGGARGTTWPQEEMKGTDETEKYLSVMSHFWVTHAVVARPPRPAKPPKMLIWLQLPGLRPVWKTLKSCFLTEREAVTQRNLSVRVEKTLIGPTWFCYANSRIVVQEADEPSAALVMNPAPSIPQVRSCAEGGRVTLEHCTACLCDHANIQTPSPPFPTSQSDLLGRNPAHFLSDPPCTQQQQHQVTASTFICRARSVKDNGLPVTQV